MSLVSSITQKTVDAVMCGWFFGWCAWKASESIGLGECLVEVGGRIETGERKDPYLCVYARVVARAVVSCASWVRNVPLTCSTPLVRRRPTPTAKEHTRDGQ